MGLDTCLQSNCERFMTAVRNQDNAVIDVLQVFHKPNLIFKPPGKMALKIKSHFILPSKHLIGQNSYLFSQLQNTSV